MGSFSGGGCAAFFNSSLHQIRLYLKCLALKVDRIITSEDVIDTLAELFAMRGVPAAIRSDNGPEFLASANQRCQAALCDSQRASGNTSPDC